MGFLPPGPMYLNGTALNIAHRHLVKCCATAVGDFSGTEPLNYVYDCYRDFHQRSMRVYETFINVNQMESNDEPRGQYSCVTDVKTVMCLQAITTI